jgi:hypothetical protein
MGKVSEPTKQEMDKVNELDALLRKKTSAVSPSSSTRHARFWLTGGSAPCTLSALASMHSTLVL